VSGNVGAWTAWLDARPGSSEARVLVGVEGCVLEPTALELTSLHAGTAFLDIRASDNDTALLRTRLPQVNITFCLFIEFWCKLEIF
jgi:hypothetical protein